MSTIILTAAFRVGLSAIAPGVVLGACLVRVENDQVLLRSRDVVPGPVGEIDKGLSIVVDRDHATDATFESLQFRAVGAHQDEAVCPHPFQLFELVEINDGHRTSSLSKCLRPRREVERLYEAARLLSTILTVHPAVMKLDGERSRVANRVQLADNALPVNAAAPRRPEVPAASKIAIGEIAIQHAAATVQCQGAVLDVDVIDPVAKPPDEFDWINTLPVKVARVESEPKLLAPVQGVEHYLRRIVVECHLTGMDLAGKAHT